MNEKSHCIKAFLPILFYWFNNINYNYLVIEVKYVVDMILFDQWSEFVETWMSLFEYFLMLLQTGNFQLNQKGIQII